ncbi:hypothetical protein Salat_1733300 [Sesamum alatum]|uniref:Uncharacterized protein n=1 Tax=Sesamum alatum TaxID=300844 RepID=A0AAE1Y812_9LAMI|nr:hypothetical protein Salat_1733300 [Sesamum alatum]
MLLRSSSAPVARSLFQDCPSIDSDNNISNSNRLTKAHEHRTAKISFGHGFQRLSPFSCNSSPVYPSNACLPEFSPKHRAIGRITFRRAQSDSNLEGLGGFYSPRRVMSESLCNYQKSTLHTEPSFSIYSDDDKFEGEAEKEDEKLDSKGKLVRSATIGASIESQFSFGRNSIGMIVEDDNEAEEVDEEEEEEEEEKERPLNRFKDLKIEIEGESMPPIDLATGAGGNKHGIGGNGGRPVSDHSIDLDKHYRKVVLQDPSNPLVLRNYAQYLESKRDFRGAEEYYSRATRADPNDGEILSRYAKSVWELHGDQARASDYFERAAKAAPEDSNVMAAYASFLWEIDGDEEEEHSSNAQVDESAVLRGLSAKDFKEETRPSSPPLHLAMGLGIGTTGFGGGINQDYMITRQDDRTTLEEYYKRVVDENPCNPLFLRNYAHFLHQSKGDLLGAEEYYSRAILADPSDGQTLSLYADIVWQLHQDKDRAVAYFERAAQATPDDSNVLASYAKFLWEAEDEEDAIEEAHNRMPVGHGAATAANA